MQLSEKMVRPNLPLDWYKPDLKLFIAYLLFSFGFVIVFGYLTYITLTSNLSLWLQIPIISLSIIFAGHSFHLFGWFGHDGVHLSLLKNKYTSLIVGIFVGAASSFPVIGYGITHWNHHRYTNQDSDPDTKIYSRYKTFWQRFFLARIVANRGYMSNTLNLIMNKPFDKGYRLPFKDTEIRFFALLNLIFMAFWATVYGYIATVNGKLALFALVLPYLCNFVISGLRIYIEHTDTGAGIFLDSRSYSSPFYTFLLFGNNFHLEHHLYPKVPSYKLPLVHKHLKEKSLFEKWGANIEPGILAPLKFVTGKYQYPEPLVKDVVVDPFDINNRPYVQSNTIS